jgi:hypothetical protein
VLLKEDRRNGVKNLDDTTTITLELKIRSLLYLTTLIGGVGITPTRTKNAGRTGRLLRRDRSLVVVLGILGNNSGTCNATCHMVSP